MLLNYIILLCLHPQIQLQVIEFKLGKPNECESNFLDVFSGKTEIPMRRKNFCGSIADAVNSDHDVMYVRYYAEPDAVALSGFKSLFTAYRANIKNKPGYIEKCETETEFDCEDESCIALELKCNGNVNCRFRWDEEGCGVSGVLTIIN